MKLKDILLSIASHNNTVEVYYDEADGYCNFGLKINNIDFKVLMDDYESLFFRLEDDINCGFRDELIISGEGNSSYILLDNSRCIKTALYFSILFDRSSNWIEDNATTYYFDNMTLPDGSVYLTKELGILKVSESIELSKSLTDEEYSKFTDFYSDLLIDFQELEVELEFYIDKNRIVCELTNIDAWYKKEMDFTLLNASSNDYCIDEFRDFFFKT